MAMWLSQEDLHKPLVSFSKVDLSDSLPDVLKAQWMLAPELSSVLTIS